MTPFLEKYYASKNEKKKTLCWQTTTAITAIDIRYYDYSSNSDKILLNFI